MIESVVKLLRPLQWYKNLLVFLAVLFSGNLFNITALLSAFVAFLSLCALSSSSYIINDIADRFADRLNPEKKNRPIASGAVTVSFAVVIALLSAAVGFGLTLLLPLPFVFVAVSLFAFSQLYSLWLKHELFADLLVIAINYVFRAVGGAFAIGVFVSPWLVGGVFFLALFLVLGKRRSELKFLGGFARRHRSVLESYGSEVTSRMSSLATSGLVLSYALYVFFGRYSSLFVTFPVAMYAVFRYEWLVEKGSRIARHPELAFTDRRLLTAMLTWLVLTALGIYLFPK